MVNQRHPLSALLSAFGKKELLKDLPRSRDTKQVSSWKKDLPEILSLHFEGELCKLDSVLWKGTLDVSCLFVI